MPNVLLARLRRSGVRGVGRFAARLGAVALRRPTEAVDHVIAQVALTRSPRTPTRVEPTTEWRRVLHERIGASWPCEEHGEFQRLWGEVATAESIVSSTIHHDADPTLAEMIWCVVRHLRPRSVVETGVGRGITSRFILEAFTRDGYANDAHLWSVDLPPLEQPWRRLVGTAVPPAMHDRWTYVRGASRRRLPKLCREIGRIDLFVHDSLHTADNLQFELATVWPHLRPGAAILIDDVDDCGAVNVLRRFTEEELLAVRAESKVTTAGFTQRL